MSDTRAVVAGSSFDTSAPVNSFMTESASVSTSQGAASLSSAFEMKTASPENTIHSSCEAGNPCIGSMTFYDTADTPSHPSSCGTVNNGGSSDVLALSQHVMTDEHCGKQVTVEYHGIFAQGIVVDKCMGCDKNSIDVSRHLFNQLADADQGNIHGVKWYID
ncbi:hypothetical protein PENANT_c069G03189 [Penicillium antarcticum]|uniref:RlpA-like protein double-psi beta-barrel domain-containing protein n=1 Tax=Penicillium antarcticum TaxID=416450 RepID=A0A1V6PQJ7_9EURO|nr:uncharacterized protein N7508_011108 [Penicillium antarcticum]KAJ5288333.1 hypothetical protein N7508_011108 [Penicillium antarcticum]OQD78972.1 hypothetical protein PENANT_c069G03189 [Penicillium antarcticum]